MQHSDCNFPLVDMLSPFNNKSMGVLRQIKYGNNKSDNFELRNVHHYYMYTIQNN